MKFLLTLPLFLITSCGGSKNLKTEEAKLEEIKKPPTRQIIGRIASVSDVGNFVLIQKYGPGKLPRNTLFQSHSVDGSSANLRPTGERVRDFFAADIITGMTTKGDPVSSFQLISEHPSSPKLSEPREIPINPTPSS